MSRVRLIVSCVALGAIAMSLFAAWPAAAAKTVKPAAQTANRFYFHDGPDPIADGGGTIANIVLPKGNWVVFVKLWVDHATAGPDIFVNCSLGLGSGMSADGDSAAFVGPAKPDGVVAGVITMSASHVFGFAGLVAVACGDLGTNAQYHQLRIQALKVGSITRTPI